MSEAYIGYSDRFIVEHQLSDVFLIDPGPDNDYLGFDPASLAKHLAPAILIADILVEIDDVLRVVGAPGSIGQFQQEWQRLTSTAHTLDEFHSQLPAPVERLAALPRTRDPMTCPRVVVTGDFFTRFSPFFMNDVRDLYAEQGIILKPVDLSDLFLHVAYDGLTGMAGDWGMKPGSLALAKACTRVFEADGRQYLQQWWGYQAGRKTEEHYRGLFAKTGLLVSRPNDVPAMFQKSSEHISSKILGEVTPTVGTGLNAEHQGYDGIILIGPFN